MDNQGWISVKTRRRTIKNENVENSVHHEEQNVKQDIPKMKVNHETLQALIRKRIQLKVNQERADTMCLFPQYTFKNLESNRLIPNESQIQRIVRIFDIQLKIDIIPS